MSLRLVIVVLIIAGSTRSFAQFFDSDYEYSREITWGVNKNTNSGLIGGVVFKYGRKIDATRFRTIGLEIINVKHPYEQKYQSGQTGATYIWAKQNYLYAIRGQYGLERVMFKKASQQGVQISYGGAIGPTLGVIAPYYVLTQDGRVPYDPNLHTQRTQVFGTGKLFQGFGDSEIAFGVNAKLSAIFEFGAFRNSVAGVELGLASELYTREIVIMPTQDNRALFGSAFITIFWGNRK